MTHSDTPKSGIGRRGFFAAVVSGVGIAALAAGARKVKATAQRRLGWPVLYRRGEEADRYFKTLD
jgi:hypothetical protein